MHLIRHIRRLALVVCLLGAARSLPLLPSGSARASRAVAPCSPGKPPASPLTDFPRTVRVNWFPKQILAATRYRHIFLVNGGDYDTRLAHLYCSGSVTIHDSQTGEAVAHVNLAGNPLGAVLDTVRSRLIVATQGGQSEKYRGKVYVIGTRRGAVLANVPLSEQPTALALDARTGRVFVATAAWRPPWAPGQVVTMNSRTGAVLKIASLGNVRAIAADSAVGKVFVSVTPGIEVLDGSNGMVLDTIKLPSGAPDQLGVDEGNDRLIAVWGGDSHGGSGGALFMRASTGHVLHSVRYPAARGADSILIDSPAHRALIGEASEGPDANTDIAVFDSTTEWLQLRTQQPPAGFTVDQSTGDLYLGDSNTAVRVVDPTTWRTLNEITVTPNIGVMSVVHDPDRLYVLHTSSQSMTIYCLQAQC